MCGFAGFVGGSRSADRRDVLSAMTGVIAHRGPDDEGCWLDDQCAVALGHRRLAIIDISPAGHQPMFSPSGRFVVVYNGEIYNHREIWADIEQAGAATLRRGHSDTETMLAGFDLWGVVGTLERLNGMFAFAVWDRSTRTLTIARDRMGEKPLYFGRSGDVFLFGSELKSLQKHPSFSSNLDREAVSLFMKHNYVPAPWTIWKDVKKLSPASFAVFDAFGNCVVEPTEYWKFSAVASGGSNNLLEDGPELINILSDALDDSVRIRMEADVPLGAFLSGGVDSSAIVASMQAQAIRPVKTFSIGFHEEKYNEAKFASKVAAYLGTDHTELYVTPQDALNVVPSLPTVWDEPFSDSSQIPTLLVSQMTRKYVTVALSGDGGDELFGGYDRYFRAMRIWSYMSMVPRQLLPGVIGVLRASISARTAEVLNRCLPRDRRIEAIGDRLPKLAALMKATQFPQLYDSLISHWNPSSGIVKTEGGNELPVMRLHPEFRDPREMMMYIDSCSYLPDDILTKVDRASMAMSLETRVPFLDHRLVELAWRIPLSAKIRNGRGKSILRDVLYRRVPKDLIDRPKMGFGVPIDQWLSGALRPWAEELLDEDRLCEDGIFDASVIKKTWKDQISGRRRNHYLLWDVLMFQAWWRANK